MIGFCYNLQIMRHPANTRLSFNSYGYSINFYVQFCLHSRCHLYVYSKVHLLHQMAGVAEWIACSLLPKLAIHHCLPSTACMRDVWKVSLPVQMLIQRTPLLVQKTGVAPDMTLRFTAHKQVRVQVR